MKILSLFALCILPQVIAAGNVAQSGLNGQEYVPLIDTETINELNISLPESHQGCHTCQIFDLGGRLFSEEVCSGRELRLNVQNLDPGLYFLRIVSQTSAITHRFLKY